jgi:Clp amino terminal domain, pathogenicity island component
MRVRVTSIVPTSRVNTVIEMAADEARRMGNHEIDTGHILIGLVLEGNGIAAHVLQDLGATADRVVAATERAFGVAESGRGLDSPAGHTWVPLPTSQTHHDIDALRMSLLRPRIVQLLRSRGLALEPLTDQVLHAPDVIRSLTDLLNASAVELSAAVATQDFERAIALRDQTKDLMAQLETAEQEWLDSLA